LGGKPLTQGGRKEGGEKDMPSDTSFQSSERERGDRPLEKQREKERYSLSFFPFPRRGSVQAEGKGVNPCVYRFVGKKGRGGKHNTLMGKKKKGGPLAGPRRRRGKKDPKTSYMGETGGGKRGNVTHLLSILFSPYQDIQPQARRRKKNQVRLLSGIEEEIKRKS